MHPYASKRLRQQPLSRVLRVCVLITIRVTGTAFSLRLGRLGYMCSYKAARHSEEWPLDGIKRSGFPVSSFTFAASGDYAMMESWFSLWFFHSLHATVPGVLFISLFFLTGGRIIPPLLLSWTEPGPFWKRMLSLEKLSSYSPPRPSQKYISGFQMIFTWPESTAWILEIVCCVLFKLSECSFVDNMPWCNCLSPHLFSGYTVKFATLLRWSSKHRLLVV